MLSWKTERVGWWAGATASHLGTELDLALVREKELMLLTLSCRNKMRFLGFWVKIGCRSTVSSWAETMCPSYKAVSGFHCDLQSSFGFFVKFTANGDTSSFFKYWAAGSDIITFGLRWGGSFCFINSSVYFHSAKEDKNLPSYARITLTVLQQEWNWPSQDNCLSTFLFAYNGAFYCYSKQCVLFLRFSWWRNHSAEAAQKSLLSGSRRSSEQDGSRHQEKVMIPLPTCHEDWTEK